MKNTAPTVNEVLRPNLEHVQNIAFNGIFSGFSLHLPIGNHTKRKGTEKFSQ